MIYVMERRKVVVGSPLHPRGALEVERWISYPFTREV
jgi:hypothetical protein